MYEVGITIIIPVYNVEEYLSECLDSILQQDFDNYEIICVNDASTDNSERILLDYAARHQCIRIFTHSQNKGLSSARNTGIQNANGKYIWFVDSDDMIVEGSLASLYYIAEKNDVDIVLFNMKKLYKSGDGHNKYISIPSHKYAGICLGRELFCQHVENQEFKVESWRQLIRADFMKKNKIRFYEGIVHEDNLFYFQCMMNARKVLDIYQELYIYRQRNGSIMSRRDYRRAQSLFVVFVQIVAYWNSNEFNDREHAAIERFLRIIYASYKRCCNFGEASGLEVGGKAEKALYAMLKETGEPMWLALNEQQIRQIRNVGKVMIFGAGLGAVEVCKQLQKEQIQVDRFVVSSLERNPKSLCGLKVDSLESLSPDLKGATIIIGVTEKYRAGIQEKLKEMGYTKIITAQNMP